MVGIWPRWDNLLSPPRIGGVSDRSCPMSWCADLVVLSPLDVLANVWLSYCCFMRSSCCSMISFALWSDNHCVCEEPKVGPCGLGTLNLWGTCWLLPIYAGFVSLSCSAVVGVREPSCWFVSSRPEVDVWVMLIVVNCNEFLSPWVVRLPKIARSVRSQLSGRTEICVVFRFVLQGVS